MKQGILRFLLFVLLLTIQISSFAYNFEVGDVFYSTTSSSTVEVSYGLIKNGTIVIPESVCYNGNYYSVTSIGDKAFFYKSSLTSINIPNSVTLIKSGAFEGCSNLASVTIGNSVTTIGDNAFIYCKSLISIVIPNGVTFIGEYNQEIKGKTNVEIIPVSA